MTVALKIKLLINICLINRQVVVAIYSLNGGIFYYHRSKIDTGVYTSKLVRYLSVKAAKTYSKSGQTGYCNLLLNSVFTGFSAG